MHALRAARSSGVSYRPASRDSRVLLANHAHDWRYNAVELLF
jgi:hypothetical protein